VPHIPRDTAVYALSAESGALLIGSAGCVFLNTGGGWAGRWERAPVPGPECQVWTLAADPRRPATVLAGCRPLALLRSPDGGRRWEPLPFSLPPGTEQPHTPRITAILAEGDRLTVGVEVGGVFVSPDAGRHWEPAQEGLPSLDIHALARGPWLLAATPGGITVLDGTWRAASLDTPWRYCRSLSPVPGSAEELLCGLGDGPPGTHGSVVRSEDGGRSWHPADFPAARSSIWSVSVSASDPDVALAGAIGGECFLSEDSGRSWRRLRHRFAEIRAVLAT
jgi:photosystem II stability/assembly factor-like uncharacterized protein